MMIIFFAELCEHFGPLLPHQISHVELIQISDHIRRFRIVVFLDLGVLCGRGRGFTVGFSQGQLLWATNLGCALEGAVKSGGGIHLLLTLSPGGPLVFLSSPCPLRDGMLVPKCLRCTKMCHTIRSVHTEEEPIPRRWKQLTKHALHAPLHFTHRHQYYCTDTRTPLHPPTQHHTTPHHTPQHNTTPHHTPQHNTTHTQHRVQTRFASREQF